MKYDNFYKMRFKPIIKELGLSEHHIHDSRHTTISLLNSAGANKSCIKKIVGHSTGGNDVTEGVYTHKTVEELLETINLID